jgi:hypothetical protein
MPSLGFETLIPSPKQASSCMPMSQTALPPGSAFTKYYYIKLAEDEKDETNGRLVWDNSYKSLVGRSQGKESLEGPKSRWQNIKVDHTELEYQCLGRYHLDLCKVQWGVGMNKVQLGHGQKPIDMVQWRVAIMDDDKTWSLNKRDSVGLW